jgi:hypothetical protein
MGEHNIDKPRCPTCDADAAQGRFSIHSLCNHELEGFVHVASGSHLRVQLDVGQAKELGLRLLEAAEAAESDAAMYRLLVRKVGLKLDAAGRMVAELRNEREAKHEVKL